MSSKNVSRYSNHGVLLSSLLSTVLILSFLADEYVYLIVALIIIYLNVMIFINSTWFQENVEKTIIMKLNLQRKVIRPQVFMWGVFVYTPAFISFIFMACMYSAFRWNMLILVVYQLVDIMLTYMNRKGYVYFITFTVFFILNVIVFLISLENAFNF